MFRTIIFFAILLLVPLVLIAGGIDGIVTGDFHVKHGRITGASARVISSFGVLAGIAIFRAYWMVIRGDGFDVNDPVFLGCLILGAVALGTGLVLMFLSVAF
jgi:hypothetical protein